MLKFTKDHEWIRTAGDIATVGITPFAQEKLGDLVFVELPAIGTKLGTGAVACIAESVKAVLEVYAPVAGEVLEVNKRLESKPRLVNADPTGDGWMFKLKVTDAAEFDALLDEQAYTALASAQDGH